MLIKVLYSKQTSQRVLDDLHLGLVNQNKDDTGVFNKKDSVM